MREEPQLITSDLLNSETSTVQPGDDPLSQLASVTTVIPISNDNSSNEMRIPSSTADHNLLNHHDDSLVSDESGLMQFGQCLSEEDHRNLRNFILDLVTKRLLPHLNEVLKNLNEWVSFYKIVSCVNFLIFFWFSLYFIVLCVN